MRFFMTQPIRFKLKTHDGIQADGFLTSSRHFAIHRPYIGDGQFSDSGWKLTHVPSGESCGNAIYHRSARKILRTMAGVLAAQNVDWSRENISYPDFAALDPVVINWCRQLVAAYR
jgi:hypothetical protein